MQELWDWIWQNVHKLRDLAAVVGVAGTLLGVGVSVWRSHVERRLQREVGAKRTYAGVLGMSFEHPDFAEPARPLHDDSERGKAYIWFVSNVLNALDEIMLSTDDTVWRDTATGLLNHHAVWLRTEEFKVTELPSYGKELQSLIAKISSEKSIAS